VRRVVEVEIVVICVVKNDIHVLRILVLQVGLLSSNIFIGV
jgi:hypothetical protein